ncbi:hypothetical protein AJ78_01389 [Emergomyces pasteurianus Ep9510]|uniref:MalT-like TPR region domain-containing protein n=1 Tax=Emergomyces pasteurianus Ep9510 TaxID=1447872 RepID=A0A1J9PRS0_9EURO|nr:hypothetical protein AJ78_01389 [Emergomyces pasteurianus Ep9510]
MVLKKLFGKKENPSSRTMSVSSIEQPYVLPLSQMQDMKPISLGPIPQPHERPHPPTPQTGNGKRIVNPQSCTMHEKYDISLFDIIVVHPIQSTFITFDVAPTPPTTEPARTEFIKNHFIQQINWYPWTCDIMSKDVTNTKFKDAGVEMNMQARYAEAEAIITPLYRDAQRNLGYMHPKTIYHMNNLGVALGGQGKFREAEAILNDTVGMKFSEMDPAHLSTLGSMMNIVLAYKGQGKWQRANEVLSQMINIRAESGGIADPDFLDWNDHLGVVLAIEQKYEEAEQVLLRCYDARQKIARDPYIFCTQYTLEWVQKQKASSPAHEKKSG